MADAPDTTVIDMDRLYKEDEAAEILLMSPRDLARARKNRRIDFIQLSPRKVAYRGVHLTRFLEANEVTQCRKSKARSESTGSPRSRAGRTGTEPGTITKLDRRAASRLARQTFLTPSSS